MKKIVTFSTGAAVAAVIAAASPAAIAAPAADKEVNKAGLELSAAQKARKKTRRQVRVYRTYPRAAQVYVVPPAYAYGGNAGYPFDPRRIGPGGAYQGNIPGCAIDLGYGRWESCDQRR